MINFCGKLIVYSVISYSALILVIWNVVHRSTSQRKLKKPLRLHPYLCETSYLDEVTKTDHTIGPDIS